MRRVRRGLGWLAIAATLALAWGVYRDPVMALMAGPSSYCQ